MSVQAKGLGGPRNGMPVTKRYVYRGDQDAAEVQRQTARARARAERDRQAAAAQRRLIDELSGGPDIGPDPEWYREAGEAAAEEPAAVLPVREPTPEPAAAIDPERYRRRDVPTSCTCRWKWIGSLSQWNRVRQGRSCPWHTGETS